MLPQRDLFGFCDNYKSASFLHNVNAATEGSCVQYFTNLNDAAFTFMDPQKYGSKTVDSPRGTPSREFLKGSSKGSNSTEFILGKVYLRDSTTGDVSDVTSTYTAEGMVRPTYDAVACTVENFVSEVQYRVYYEVDSQGLYTIDSIQIEFMLDSKLTLDKDKFCRTDGTNSEEFLITQKFGINFVVARSDGGDPPTLEGIAATGQVTRSGNPGY